MCLALRGKRGVQSSQQALGRCFFVTGCAIDLARKIESFDESCFQRVVQVSGIEEIVLDCVTWSGDMRVLESLDLANQGELHIKRKAGRNTIGVKFMCVQTLRFDENLMGRLVRKTHYLVFN